MINRILAILLGLDITLYAIITLGDCNRRETLSGAAYRTEQSGKVIGKISRPMIDAFFALFGDKDHCRLTNEHEKQMGIV